MNINKALLIVAGLTTVSLVGITAVNTSYPFDSSASGITENGNERVFTLNTQLNIEGKVGTANFGNIAVKARDCSALDGGVALLNDGNLMVYCPTAAMVDGYYVGFANSSITSVQMTFNDLGESRTLRLKWCKFNESFSPEARANSETKKFTMSTEGTDDNQTVTVDSGDFIERQNTEKNLGYTCIEIETKDTHPIALYSFVVTYTCN